MKRLICLLSLLLVSSVEGTHGMFPDGYGTRALGMGGVAAAYPQDTIISATNPAGMFWLCDSVDVGLQIFSPKRRYKYTALGGDAVKSGRDYFFVPHIGSVCKVDCWHALGVSLYGNGGMNTSYPRNNPVFGINDLGIDYLQGIIAPTWAFQIFPDTLCCHSIGVAPLIGIQTIKIAGLQNFQPFSLSPDHVTNNKYDWAGGLGVRAGWMGVLIPRLWKGSRLWGGAAYSTKIYMMAFRKYKGLFANHGKLDIPANYSLGLRLEATPCFNIAFDFQRILYHEVRAIGNPIDSFFAGVPFGDKHGPGFGWKNISIYKVGADYTWGSCLTLRAGGSFGPIPYDTSNLDFNILAPAVVKYHATIGATYCLSRCHQLDFAFQHAFDHSIEGASRLGLGILKEKMYQNLLEVNYAFIF